MNYYVFQVSDQKTEHGQRKAQEVFDILVAQNSVWGFGLNAANRKAIAPGDKVLFYLTGTDNQYFAGAATLISGAYDNPPESRSLFLDENTLRIDLQDVLVFPEPRYRKEISGLEWRPAMGSSSKIIEKDYLTVLGTAPSQGTLNQPEDMEFALEKYLQEFIESNWQKIHFGDKLHLFRDSNGNSGSQYVAGDAGYIDLLAQDESKQFVVLELKKGRKNDEVVGQVLRYLTWVEENLSDGREARAIIIVREKDRKLELAVRQVSHKVKVLLYKIDFSLQPYN